MSTPSTWGWCTAFLHAPYHIQGCAYCVLACFSQHTLLFSKYCRIVLGGRSDIIWCLIWLLMLFLCKNVKCVLCTFVLHSNNQFKQKITKTMRKTLYMCMCVEFLFPRAAKCQASALPHHYLDGLPPASPSYPFHCLCSLSFSFLSSLYLLPAVYIFIYLWYTGRAMLALSCLYII